MFFCFHKDHLLFFEDEINHSDKFKGVPIGVEKDTLKIKHYDFDKFFTIKIVLKAIFILQGL